MKEPLSANCPVSSQYRTNRAFTLRNNFEKIRKIFMKIIAMRDLVRTFAPSVGVQYARDAAAFPNTTPSDSALRFHDGEIADTVVSFTRLSPANPVPPRGGCFG